MLIDTHCHIHEADYPLDITETLRHAHEQGIDKFICVGTSEESSRLAVAFAAAHSEAYAAIGVHPHESKDGWSEIKDLLEGVIWKMEGGEEGGSTLKSANSHIPNSTSRIVAIGEIGLDYFYTHSPREVQMKALESQIELALQYDLPIVFHVREAFDDFWPIFNNFHGIRGELHSFTDNQANLDIALAHGLFIGVNGISTFSRNDRQRDLFAHIPLARLLLETDAPFLTPVPFRGTVNEPAFVRNVAEYNAKIRQLTLDDIATATSINAHALFAI